MKRLILLSALLQIAAANPPSTLVIVSLEGMRNSRGVVRACLMRSRSAFPDCIHDPEARKVSVPASARELRFTAVPSGVYALALFHDENSNGKLDTILGIPREGFGFSRNPEIRFHAPSFDSASITVSGAITRLAVRVQYVL